MALFVPWVVARPAVAQTRSSDKAAAEALFGEGRQLMERGSYPEACAKFESSQRLDPGVGTMLNLAQCYEKVGRTASAWAEFREVISAARAADSKEREELARERADALEPTLSRLTLVLSVEASSIEKIEVRRDGVLVDAAELGSAIPVDPGRHRIEASAPGRRSWSKTVEVGPSGTQTTISVPELEPASLAQPAVETTPVNTPTHSKSSQRTFALVAGGVGVIGVGVGTVFGLKAISNWKDAKALCTDYPYGCASGADGKASDAKNAATLSTIGWVFGAVGVATGAVLWFTAGSGEEAGTALGVGPSSVTLRGRF